MSRINWVEEQIPKHLSKTVQNIMRKHLLKEYHAREIKVLTCPECGATEDETLKSRFSGPEPAIRRQGKQAECKKCGFQGLIPPSLLTMQSEEI